MNYDVGPAYALRSKGDGAGTSILVIAISSLLGHIESPEFLAAKPLIPKE
jgi:hypothetical protein